MIELIRIVRKSRHIIENVKKITVVFTDHVTNVSIVKQTTLSSENIDKLNFKFVQVLAYFSQFNINVKYKADKINIVLNALSRLLSINAFKNSTNINIFDIDSYHNVIKNIFIIHRAF